jgi:hypothetical protein
MRAVGLVSVPVGRVGVGLGVVVATFGSVVWVEVADGLSVLEETKLLPLGLQGPGLYIDLTAAMSPGLNPLRCPITVLL